MKASWLQKTLIAVLLVFGLALAFGLPYYGARESKLNRELLCIAIVGNDANTAHDNPRVLEICDTVGVP